MGAASDRPTYPTIPHIIRENAHITTFAVQLSCRALPCQRVGVEMNFWRRKISRAAIPVCYHISEMQAPSLPPGTTQRTLAIIMGGGAGTRLFPLTKDRAKPAVPLGGKYRLVDIPISNCLNSGLRSI